MLTKKKRQDQTTCFSRAASKLHSGANKIQILLLKGSRRDLVGVTLFPLSEAKEEKGLVSLGIWDTRPQLFAFQKAAADRVFHSSFPKAMPRGQGSLLLLLTAHSLSLPGALV